MTKFHGLMRRFVLSFVCLAMSAAFSSLPLRAGDCVPGTVYYVGPVPPDGSGYTYCDTVSGSNCLACKIQIQVP